MLYETIRQADLKVKLGIMTVSGGGARAWIDWAFCRTISDFTSLAHLLKRSSAVAREERGIH